MSKAGPKSRPIRQDEPAGEKRHPCGPVISRLRLAVSHGFPDTRRILRLPPHETLFRSTPSRATSPKSTDDETQKPHYGAPSGRYPECYLACPVTAGHGGSVHTSKRGARFPSRRGSLNPIESSNEALSPQGRNRRTMKHRNSIPYQKTASARGCQAHIELFTSYVPQSVES